MTPNDPDFYSILHTAPPPGWRDRVNSDFRGVFAVRSDSLCLSPLSEQEMIEYCNDGEYEELEWLDDSDTGY